MRLQQKVSVQKFRKIPISAETQLSNAAACGNAACLNEPLGITKKAEFVQPIITLH